MDFTCAFQPIIDITHREIFSYEALVCGKNGETASVLFSQIADEDLIQFDRLARQKALILAKKLHLPCYLHLNFLARSFTEDKKCVTAMLKVAQEQAIKPDKIIIEITEKDVIYDMVSFSGFVNEVKSLGIKIAIDDFGAGYSGLNMLIDFLPDFIKLNIRFVKNVHKHRSKQALIKAVMQIAVDLGIEVIAEGVETPEELQWLEAHNIKLYQGFLFAKPGVECLPKVVFPNRE